MTHFIGDRPWLRLLGVPQVMRVDRPTRGTGELTEPLSALLLLGAGAGVSSPTLLSALEERHRPTTVWSTLSRARRVLGVDGDGPLLPRAESRDGLWWYPAPRVGSDWGRFQMLANGPLSGLSTERLTAALMLVEGEPLAGSAAARWRWADPHRESMIGSIIDVAGEVSRRLLDSGDVRGAWWAVRVGLRVDSLSTPLLVLQLQIARQTGDRGYLRRLSARILADATEFGVEIDAEVAELLVQK